MAVLLIVQLVLVGLIAGEEFIVRWGVQPALSSLPDDAHIRARIALVKKLKLVVPILMVPAVIVSIALLVATASANGLAWRIAATTALIVFILASFLGTVPINIGVNNWGPTEPPANWRSLVTLWERIDVLRSTAAGISFALYAIAAVIQLS
ncbi:MAG: DUF1772 domain-containing protein [Cryobacterium sp.]|nr:DUF1772 domain-containing protein [Cryobacterium sp.]